MKFQDISENGLFLDICGIEISLETTILDQH